MNTTYRFNRHRSLGRALHKAVTICLLASLLAGLIPPPLVRSLLPAPAAELAETLLPEPMVAQAAGGSITGTVFQDYNADGVRNTTSTTSLPAIDYGVGDVTVTAYDADGSQCGQTTTSTTTATLGQYTLTHTCTAATVRVEFTGLPTGYQSGPQGTNSGTGVQFVSATASNVNFGINHPCDYCQNAPTLATTYMVAGNQMTNTGVSALPNTKVVVSFGYNSTTSTGAPTGEAMAKQVGTTFGLGYQRSTETIFAGAYMKRHAGFGPGGPGAIYSVNPGADGVRGNADDVINTFLDLDAASYFGAGSFGVDPHPTSTENIAQTPYNWFHDNQSLDDVSKMGFGDLDMAEDDQELYAVNLFDRSLYRIPVGNPPTAPTKAAITVVSIPTALPGASQSCAGADVRPFGLGVHRQLVYVGMVCSAQISQLTTDLRAYVYSFDPATNSFGTAPVLEFPLSYTRSGNFTKSWKPYMDTFATLVASTATDGVATFTNYPQPILSDIAFDRGEMILGFRDRAGDQLGKYAGDVGTGAPGNFYYVAASGDILRACANGSGGWNIENDGTCGGVTTTGSSSTNAGPGGGEFYLGDKAPYPSGTNHVEASEGTLAQVPGAPEVVVSAIDATGLNSGGFEWLNNTTGLLADAYEVYQSTSPSGAPSSPSTSQTPDTTFGKAGGIGDVEVLCDPAPIQIGNRVWNDANSNGIQDADEGPLPTVTVELYKTGVKIGQATTNAQGEYYFTSGTSSSDSNTNDNTIHDGGMGIRSGTGTVGGDSDYEIRIPNVTGGSKQAALGTNVLTMANAGSKESIDSDGAIPSGQMYATYAIPYADLASAGYNNHTYDFGFGPQPTTGTIQIVKNTVGDDGTFDFSSADTDLDAVSITTVGNTGDSGTPFTKNAGTYTISEDAPPANWALTNLTCTGDPDYIAMLASREVVIDLDAGETIICTFTNTYTAPNPGGFTISKAIDTTDGSSPSVSGSFDVVVSCPGVSGYPATLSLNANGTPISVGNLVSGTVCSFSEDTLTLPAAPSGYTWVNAQISPSSITIASNMTATVTATNWLAPLPTQPTQVLTVTKTIAGTGSGPFDLTISGPSGYLTTTTIDGGQTKVLTGLASGIYTVTESTPAGWTTVYTATTGYSAGSSAVVTLTNSITATLSGVNQITGMVYYDYNSDGQITDNGTINETGVPSVTVSAYNTAGSLVGSATTGVSGTYTITPNGVGPYRVEFSNVANGFYPTTHGSQNGASVQFVDEVAQATDVNFGINYPSDYCDNAPAFCMPAHHSTAGEALYWVDYTNGASAGIATNSEVGSLWGLAYQRSTDTLYAASFLRRNVSLGPNGLGAIYQTASAAGTNSLFFDVATVPGVNVGSFDTALRNSNLDLDPEAYDKTGKVGLGDIDIADDESTLWTVSLNDKKLLAIPVVNPTASNVQSYTIPDPGCRVGSGDYRPFATKYYRGQVYVGVVCDAEISQDRNDLAATIYRFDPSNPPAGFAIALSFPLTYTKGTASSYNPNSEQWFPWVGSAQGYPPPGAPSPLAQGTLPSPVLADIEFDVDGSMIIGFQDRFLEQASSTAVYPDNTATPSLVTGGGDILRAYNNNGVFVLENNGTAGPVSGVADNDQGPGGGEFYWGDEFLSPLSDIYRDTTLGGLALLPGSGEVVVGAWDPTGAFDVSGVKFLSNSNGAYKRGIDVFGTGSRGKGGGVGDIELLCDSAPLEIGNRVWNDVNGNGVQDPGEPGLNGLTVSLQTPTGISTTVTSGEGAYYFTVQPHTDYTITVGLPSGYSLTLANEDSIDGTSASSNHAISDTRDSDAVSVGGMATIYYTTGSAGQNNHGLDFGFTKPASGQVEILNIAPVVVADPGGFTISKAIDTTDGSSPSVSGSFDVVVSCPGVSGYPATLSLNANGTPITVSNLADGTVCSFNEDTLTLPSTPTGYTWVNAQIDPASITIQSNMTATVTATNWLAPLPTQPTSVLTVTKTISGTGSGPFDLTISGPSGYLTTTAIDGGQSKLLTGLASGVYTVTESTPAGWTTVYTATTGYSTGSSAVVTLTNAITAATTAAGQITGIVYNDYNSNGVQDTTGTSPNLAVDGGVAGVIVTAYDRNSAVAGTATADANGLYTLTTTASGLTGPYRLEFSNLPAGYEPTTHGSDNGTSTQFVSAPATNVNFGVLQPADYCQNNPTLCTNVYIEGDAATDTSAPLGTLQQMSYDGGPISTVATRNQVGSTWGLAYERQSQMLYSAAFLRRYSGLGNGGGASNPLGAIYATNISLATTSLFIDVSTLGASVGTIPTDTARGLSSPNTPSHDTEAFAKITKVGLGDMDISSDGSTLYVTSLNDKTIYAIDIASKALVGSYPFGDSIVTCTGGEFRPFALKMYQGNLYAGGVCDASVSKNRDDLTSFVYRLEGNTFNLQLTIPLTYTKGGAVIDAGVCGTPNVRWNAWDDSLNSLITCNGAAVYPQPVLSDIEFDTDGSLILGYRDRTGDQMGVDNYGPDPSDVNLYRAYVGGDILRACRNAFGNFVLETNGECGGVTTSGANNNEGPGGGEYYAGDYFSNLHGEVSVGGLALIAGSGQLVSTVMDPVNWWSGGLRKFSNTTGGTIAGYEFYADFGTSGYMGKANGLGDAELLCDSPPLEIGNRVWNDVNGNGVQDPGEPGLNGLTVSLQAPTGTVGTVATGGDGNYYFANLQPNTQYTLTISIPPTGYSLTTANAEALIGASVSSNHAISDTRDSDAVLVGGLATIYYTTGGPGQNNHGLDFGFTQSASGQVDILNTAPESPAQFGDRVWIESDGDGLAATGVITPVAGLIITATDGVNLYTAMTDANGYYSFTVPAGSYVVTYGAIPTQYGTVVPSVAPAGSSESGTAGNYAEAGDPDAGHVNGTTVTVAAGEANWRVDFALYQPQPLAPITGILTVTKSVNWNGNTADAGQQFAYTIAGPAGFTTINDTITDTGVMTYSVPFGVYTVTETSPGAGWLMTYTVDSSTRSNSGVVELRNNSPFTALTPAAIAGTVFRDFNSNGVYESGSNEVGMANITITAYDSNGIDCGSTTSGGDGTYSFIPTCQGSWRIEFTDLPVSYVPSFVGSGSGSSTQFITTSGATDINFAVNKPTDFCQANPTMASSCLASGDPLAAGTSASSNVLVSFAYNNSGRGVDLSAFGLPANAPAAQSDATNAEVGPTWGMAYQRSTKTLFASALVRRHIGVGPLGEGGIYTLDYTDPANPTVAGWLDVTTIGMNVGTVGTGATPALRNTSRGLAANAGTANSTGDQSAFDVVGKVGLGDIDLSEDESTLWVVNLNNQSLNSIVIDQDNNPATAPTASDLSTFAIPNGCSSGPHRPWAVKTYEGNVYVGVVCQDVLEAYIYRFDGATFQPVLIDGNATIDLSYTKGVASTNCPAQTGWYTWTTTPAAPCVNTDPTNLLYTYPVPMFSDIEFDVDGSMIISFMDRSGHQFGAGNTQYDGTGLENYHGAGDILHICNVTGNFVMQGGAGCSNNANNNQGPNGGEYYGQDEYNETTAGIGGRGVIHAETVVGGLALRAGSGEVAAVSYDPNNTIFVSGGINWFNNTNGAARDPGYMIYIGQDADGFIAGSGRQGKANGMGDLELLCDQAPLQIGNRVWDDLDGDGIQDADEPGLNGLTVTLEQAGQAPQTVTTSGDGNYSFVVDPKMVYTITVQAPTGYQLTLPNQDAIGGSSAVTNEAILDTRDSDASLVNDIPTILYTTGGPGQNNHGLDFGFVQPVNGQVDILNTAPAQQEYDLALRKRVVNQTANPDGSRVATYAIELFNQGDVAASNIELVDYLPANSTLGTPANGWTASGSDLALTVPGPIAPGESTTVELVLNIGATATGHWVTNTAEIAADDGDDSDSTPDTTNDDELVDDEIADNPTTGTDEDDHDIAVAPPICPTATIWNGGVYNDSQGAFVTNVEGLDWSSAGSGVFEGIGPIGTSAPTGTQFTLRYQAVLVGLTNPTGNSINFNGLNTDFEYTIIAEIPMIVISELDIVGTQFLALGTQPGGQVYIYKDLNNNAIVTTGLGFDDGELIASGYVDAGQVATFQYVSATASATGSFTFNAPITYIDSSYIDPTDKLAQLRLEGTLNSPPLDSTTTTFFAGRAGEGNLEAYTVDTNNDILLKVDTSSKLYECIPDAQFGDRVWLEDDGDGYADTGNMTPIAGMVITATNGTETYTTTTNAAGYYSFTVSSGAYTVTYGTVPAAYGTVVPSTVVSGTTESGNAGSYTETGNPDANHGQNTVVTVAASEANWQVDFAFTPVRYSLGNRLWIDDGGGIPANRDNGLYDANELPVAEGVVVELLTITGTVVATTTTDSAGYYRFDDLLAGDYRVHIPADAFQAGGLLAGMSSSSGITDTFTTGENNLDHGDDDTSDGVTSDVITLGASNPTGEVDDAVVGAGTTGTNGDANDNLTVDFGFVPPLAQFGDRIWIELDGDGIAATGTLTPVEGMVITATNGTEVYTTTTNAQGYYSFTVPADTYTVSYGTVPGTYGAVIPSNTPGGNSESGNAGSYAAAGQPDRSHANATTVTVAAGEANWLVDFAFWLPQPTITVEKYTNGDDADTPTGPTLAVGDTVTWTYIITNTGNVTLTNITLVDDMEGSVSCPATALAPNGTVTCLLTGTATAGQYANTAVVTGTPTITGTVPVTATDPSHYTGLTAGIGDRVWYDDNQNGLQDLGETGVPSVTVELRNSSGALLSTTATSAAGYYSFTNLAPGIYSIRFVSNTLPAGYLFTQQDANNNNQNAADSDANPTTSATINTLLVGDEYDPDWDAGIWLPQPSITLEKATSSAGSLPADADSEPGPSLTAGQTVTWTYVITNSGNVTLTNITLVDNVEGSVNCPATTLGPNAAVTCTLTGIAIAGQYSNTAVVTGTPTISGTLPVTATDPSHYHVPLYSLGNRLWIDDGAGILANRDNGIYDAGELPVAAGVVIELQTITGTLVATTTTDSAGYYRFDDLLAGDYRVHIPANAFQAGGLLAGMASSSGITDTFTTGENNLDHGDDDTSDGVTSSTITLSASNPTGEVDDAVVGAGTTGTTGDANDNLTADFGFVPPPAQFGDRVWIESDGDGIAATGTLTPVEGMVITATNGTEVYTTTTNAQGYYSFTVPADAYSVTYGSVPATYGTVVASATPGGNSESGDAGQYQESGDPDRSHEDGIVVTLVAGEANWFVDFAFTPVNVFDLALIKTLAVGQSATVQPGDLVTFTLTISNQGTTDAYDIDLIDYLSADMSLAATGGLATWSSNGVTATITISQLNAGQTTTIDITLQVSATFTGTQLTNWAEIADASDRVGGPTATDIDSTPDGQNGNTFGEDSNLVNDAAAGDGKNGGDEDDHDPATVAVGEPVANLRLVKTADQQLVLPGDTLIYQLTLTNDGPDTARAIVIEDLLPADVRYISHDPAAAATYAITSHTVEWTVATLAANSSATLFITVVVEE